MYIQNTVEHPLLATTTNTRDMAYACKVRQDMCDSLLAKRFGHTLHFFSEQFTYTNFSGFVFAESALLALYNQITRVFIQLRPFLI